MAKRLPISAFPQKAELSLNIQRPSLVLTAGLVLLADVLMLLLAALLGGQLWLAINPLVQPQIFHQLWPLLAIFPLAFALRGLYPGIGINPVDELRQLTLATTTIYLVVVLALFLSKELLIASRGIYLSAWFFSLLLVPFGRACLRHFFAKRAWWGASVLVLGAGKTGRLVLERLRNHPGLGLKVLAMFDDDPGKLEGLAGVEVVGPLAHASKLAGHLHIRHVLVAMPGVQPSQLSQLVRQYAAVFPNVIIVPDLFGMSSLNISARDFNGIVGLHARQNLLLKHNHLLKRLLDLLLLIPSLIIATPLMLCLALWIVLLSPGNPFYRQRREGYRGKPIYIYKLRTMYHNADALLEQHLQAHPEARVEWESRYKLKRDPRILPGAQLLRKLSLDELPQLLNILRGEMSFVGPRPFPYYHLEQFNEPFRVLRSEAQPGITGLWQVTIRSDGDLSVQEELDSYYIRNWSLWLDLYILARTPWAVFFSKGAY